MFLPCYTCLVYLVNRFLGSNMKKSRILPATSPRHDVHSAPLLPLQTLQTSCEDVTQPDAMAISQAAWASFVRYYGRPAVSSPSPPSRALLTSTDGEYHRRAGADGGGEGAMLLYVDDLEREHNYCSCMRDRRGMRNLARIVPMQWLLHCPKYQAGLSSILPGTAHEVAEKHRHKSVGDIANFSIDGAMACGDTANVLSPFILDVSLEELVLSLPVPLEANSSSMLSSNLHCH